MSHQSYPFVFGAGAGQAAPAVSASAQHPQQQIPSGSAPGQQMAFQLPGVDMSALAGVSPDQVALIARLLQSGALPLPPPPPGAPAQAATAPIAAAPPTASPAQAIDKLQDDADLDKEEGEVEEGEANNKPEQRGSETLLPPPHARSLNEPLRRSPPRGPRNRGSANGVAPLPMPENSATTKPHVTTNGHASSRAVRELQSRDFVIAMHQAGYAFHELAQMVDSPKSLRRMFKQLGLPVTSDHGASGPSQPNSKAAPQDQLPNTPAKSPLDVPGKPSSTQRPALPKPAGKPDRKEYLAKLQALKGGKPGSVATPPLVQKHDEQPQTPQNAKALEAGATIPAQFPAAPVAAPNSASKAVKTDLIRQRLEEFKAKQAVRQNGKLPSSNVPVSSISATKPSETTSAQPRPAAISTTNTLGVGISNVATSTNHPQAPTPTQEQPSASNTLQAIVPPAPSTPSRSFSSLPGLFMPNKPPQQASPLPPAQPTIATVSPVTQISAFEPALAASSIHDAAGAEGMPAPLSLPRKRMVASEFESRPSSAKRPFGQSRSASEDESYIIENSDDEDHDMLMDIDTDVGDGTGNLRSHAKMQTTKEFLSKRNSAQASVPSTPGLNSPGGVVYEQKLKAIEELNRKIAEKEARTRAQAKTTSSMPEASAVTGGLPGISTPSRTSSVLQGGAGQMAAPMAATPTPDRTASAAALKLKQQKEELSRRIAELESARLQATPQAVHNGVSGLATGQPTEAGEPLSNAQKLDNIRRSQPESPAASKAAVPAPMNARSAPEDGDIDDESDFDFYGDEEVTVPEPVEQFASAEKADSQATTVSAVTEAEADPQERLAMSTSGVQHPSPTARDMAVAEAPAYQAARTEDTNVFAQPQLAAADADGSVSEPAEVQSPTPESDVEMQTDSSSSDGSEEDDESDLNGAVASTTANAVNGSDLHSSADGVRADSPKERDADDESDMDSSDASSTHGSDSEDYEPPSAAVLAQESPALPSEQPIADDLAPELQPSNEQVEAAANEQHLEAKSSQAHYTPYSSILTKFKDYRYHPQYLDTVPSGYKSRTYNHQIDPMTAICQTETAGGVCGDENCDAQHFERLGIPDNDLLAQMGMRDAPVRGRPESDEWNAGLQTMIRNLKATNVRDANAIAVRIAAYRREFVGDPTRVIDLAGRSLTASTDSTP